MKNTKGACLKSALDLNYMLQCVVVLYWLLLRLSIISLN